MHHNFISQWNFFWELKSNPRPLLVQCARVELSSRVGSKVPRNSPQFMPPSVVVRQNLRGRHLASAAHPPSLETDCKFGTARPQMGPASLALAGLDMNDLGVGRYELQKFPSFVCYTGVFSPFLFLLFEACSLATSDTERPLECRKFST